MRKTWVVNVRRQCRKVKVPFFFKQWGGVRKSQNGRELDGRTYDEFPDVQRNAVPDAATRKALAAQFDDVWPIPPAVPNRQTA